jgi:hypothetical protein
VIRVSKALIPESLLFISGFLNMRKVLRRAAFAAAMMAFGAPLAGAQDYPSHSVKIIIGFGPGSSANITARVRFNENSVSNSWWKTSRAPAAIWRRISLDPPP